MPDTAPSPSKIWSWTSLHPLWPRALMRVSKEGNVPVLFRPGPRTQGICFLASFLTNFYSCWVSSAAPMSTGGNVHSPGLNKCCWYPQNTYRELGAGSRLQPDGAEKHLSFWGSLFFKLICSSTTSQIFWHLHYFLCRTSRTNSYRVPWETLLLTVPCAAITGNLRIFVVVVKQALRPTWGPNSWPSDYELHAPSTEPAKC